MNPAVSHAAPFVTWIALMLALDPLGVEPAWAYAIRSAATLAALLVCRPWRHYARPELRNVPVAFAAGVAVFAAWVFFETRLAPAGVREVYERWAVLPLGAAREPIAAYPFHPDVCGWPLALVRLAGSALVIAVAEEFFWRGFLMRWIQRGSFLSVDPARVDRAKFWIVALAFGFEHAEWLAGLAAGAAYGALYARSRDLGAACLAHALTNFMLGLYVIRTGAWQFW